MPSDIFVCRPMTFGEWMSLPPSNRFSTLDMTTAFPSTNRSNTMSHHPAVSSLLGFFAYEHLPEHLQTVSRPFSELAHSLADSLPSNSETTVALRKLLESKDCAVRSALET